MTPPTQLNRCDRARQTLHSDSAKERDRAQATLHVQTCPLCATEQRLQLALHDARSDDTQWDDAQWDDTQWEDAQWVALAHQRPHRSSVLLLAALAIPTALQFILGVSWLVGANPAASILGRPSSEHLARDGALGLLMAAVACTCLARPRWARALSPVAIVILLVHLAGGFLDRHEGRVAWHFEAIHAISLLIVVLVLAVALMQRRPENLA
jgi:hypothetical protein